MYFTPISYHFIIHFSHFLLCPLNLNPFLEQDPYRIPKKYLIANIGFDTTVNEPSLPTLRLQILADPPGVFSSHLSSVDISQ